jgi:cytochrome c-type biogenesis protein CcmH
LESDVPLSLDEFVLWFLFAASTAAVVAYLLRAIGSGGASIRDEDQGVTVYRDQLAEVERDFERGLLAEGEAEAARLEISRRLIAAADEAEMKPGRSVSGGWKAVLAVVAFALPVFVLVTYLMVGSPGLTGQPYAERLAQPLNELPVEGLVARLEQRLKEEPEDARGWRLIGPVYLQMGRYGDAINAFGRVMQIEGRDPDALAGLAEALTLSGDGMVPPPARQAFEAALELDPSHARARFYLALSKAQTGQFEEALDAWRSLLEDAPEGAPWRAAVEEQISAVQQRLDDGPASAN